MTYTHANLKVSGAAHAEVAQLLRAAGYDHAFGPDGEIDMHGIALVTEGGQLDVAGIVSEIGEAVLLEQIGRCRAAEYFGFKENQ